MRFALFLLFAASIQVHAYDTNVMHDDGTDAGKVPVTSTRLKDYPDEAPPSDAQPAAKTANWKGFDADGPSPNLGGGYTGSSGSSSTSGSQIPETAQYAQPATSTPKSSAAPTRAPTAATIPQGQPLTATPYPAAQTPTPTGTQPAPGGEPTSPNGSSNVGGFLGVRGSSSTGAVPTTSCAGQLASQCACHHMILGTLYCVD